MWRIIVLAAALAACGDNLHPATKDAAPEDAAVDVPAAIGPCLDRPPEPTKAPAGQLPCELISPAFHP